MAPERCAVFTVGSDLYALGAIAVYPLTAFGEEPEPSSRGRPGGFSGGAPARPRSVLASADLLAVDPGARPGLAGSAWVGAPPGKSCCKRAARAPLDRWARGRPRAPNPTMESTSMEVVEVVAKERGSRPRRAQEPEPR